MKIRWKIGEINIEELVQEKSKKRLINPMKSYTIASWKENKGGFVR